MPYSRGLSLGILLTLSLTACGQMEPRETMAQAGLPTETSTPSPSLPATPPPLTKAEPLVWESANYPERQTWSNRVLNLVEQHYAKLELVKDMAVFCPTYPLLNRAQRINLWADVFAGLAYYESAWKPKTNSVDVGTTQDKDTWSVGLLQLSVVDQQNYALDFGFDFADLQDPLKNLELGVAIMAKQIARYKTILIPLNGNGLYWATLHPGGKYDETAAIVKMTRKLSFCR